MAVHRSFVIYQHRDSRRFLLSPSCLVSSQEELLPWRTKRPDPFTSLVVDHNYLDNSLDLLVLVKACSLANKIVVKGEGTKDIVKGSWPPSEEHHKLETGEDWVRFVQKHATTCEYFVPSS